MTWIATHHSQVEHSPPDSDATWKAFDAIVSQLWSCWRIWVESFCINDDATTNEEVKRPVSQALRQTAPTFWQCARWSMLVECTMLLMKLTDPERQRGQENLTLCRILDVSKSLCKHDHDKQLLEYCVKQAVDIARSPALKTVRNKILAHADVRANLDRDDLLDKVQIDNLDKAIRAVKSFQKRVSIVHTGRSIDAQSPEMHPNHSDFEPYKVEATRLARALECGLAFSRREEHP